MPKWVKQGKSNERELKNQGKRNLNRQNTYKYICKIPQFWAKAINTAHHVVLERRHPEVTKESYYVLSLRGANKKLPAHRLLWFNRIPSRKFLLWENAI